MPVSAADSSRDDFADTGALFSDRGSISSSAFDTTPNSPQSTSPPVEIESDGESVHLRCCCGTAECQNIQHNYDQLVLLRRDLHRAGQLGQALLQRHESYKNQVEQERTVMLERISSLEAEKKDVEEKNVFVIRENRQLLDSLEQLASDMTNSEAHVHRLESALITTESSLQKTSVAASRAGHLEAQLSILEDQQAYLQRSLIRTEDEKKSAVVRWKRAEKALTDLQLQIEQLERESQEERRQHDEFVAHIERQNEEYRQSGTVSTSLIVKERPASVSNLVKDLLQENATLQQGVVELRDLLLSSNEEIQNLRDKIEEELEDEQATPQQHRTLGAELAAMEPLSPEYHVHHHYHVTSPIAEEKTPARRKPRRHRASPSLGGFSSPPRMDFVTTRRRRQSSSLGSIMMPDSPMHVFTPQLPTPNRRWSAMSESQASTSALSPPSSPQSVWRDPHIFDDSSAVEVSSPTSESSVAFSNHHQKRFSRNNGHAKTDSNVSFQSLSAVVRPTPLQEEFSTENPAADPGLVTDVDSSSHDEVEESPLLIPLSRPLKRSTSHESILSLKQTYSYMPLIPMASKAKVSMVQTAPFAPASSTAVLSLAPVLGTITRSSGPGLEVLRTRGAPSSRSTSTSSTERAPVQSNAPKGFWPWKRWVSSGTPSTAGTSTTAAPPTSVPSPALLIPAASKPTVSRTEAEFWGRPMGVNQSGPVPGFRLPPKPKPGVTITADVNHEALAASFRDSLLG